MGWLLCAACDEPVSSEEAVNIIDYSEALGLPKQSANKVCPSCFKKAAGIKRRQATTLAHPATAIAKPAHGKVRTVIGPEHGPFCAYCGACKEHPDERGDRCWDSEDHKHAWNYPYRNPPDDQPHGQL